VKRWIPDYKKEGGKEKKRTSGQGGKQLLMICLSPCLRRGLKDEKETTSTEIKKRALAITRRGKKSRFFSSGLSFTGKGLTPKKPKTRRRKWKGKRKGGSGKASGPMLKPRFDPRREEKKR